MSGGPTSRGLGHLESPRCGPRANLVVGGFAAVFLLALEKLREVFAREEISKVDISSFTAP